MDQDKKRESFFLKLSESLYTEGTHVDVYKTGKSGFCIIGDL